VPTNAAGSLCSPWFGLWPHVVAIGWTDETHGSSSPATRRLAFCCDTAALRSAAAPRNNSLGTASRSPCCNCWCSWFVGVKWQACMEGGAGPTTFRNYTKRVDSLCLHRASVCSRQQQQHSLPHSLHHSLHHNLHHNLPQQWLQRLHGLALRWCNKLQGQWMSGSRRTVTGLVTLPFHSWISKVGFKQWKERP